MLVRIIKEFGLLLRVKQRTGRAVTECVTLLRWICQVSWLSPRFPLVLQTRGPSLLYSSLFLSLRVSLLSREFYMQSATLLAYVIQTTPTHSCKKKTTTKKPREIFRCQVRDVPSPVAFSTQTHRNTSRFRLPLSFLWISVFVFYSPSLRKNSEIS